MGDSQRIVLIGKSGSGKSSLANAIFGEVIFKVNHSSDSKKHFSESYMKKVNGLSLTLIDTPGIFNADRSVLQTELQSCMVECAPGPHAVILVLPVEKFTEQEQAIVDQIKKHFGEEAFRFTTVVFTHGDQLPDNMHISEFVQQSKGLSDLVQECGGRCHVVDHKYWKNKQEDPYRSNEFQVKNILDSINKTVSDNNSSFFTNAMLEKVERDIQTEQERLQTSEGLSLEESRAQAKTKVLQKYIDNASKKWSYLKYSVIAGIVAVVAVYMTPKVMKLVTEKPPLPPAAAPPPVVPPFVVPLPPVKEPTPPEDVVEVLQEVVKPIKTALESILERLEDLFDKIYDPYNPFD